MVFRFTGGGNGHSANNIQKKMMISQQSLTLLNVAVLKASFLKGLPVY